MTLRQAIELNSDEIPEVLLAIQFDDIQLLWHSDFYDGMLSGMLKYKRRYYWCQAIAENDNRDDNNPLWYRRFAVISLTQEQIKEERYWHKLFRKHVGTHTDYQNNKRVGKVHSIRDMSKFYTPFASRQERDFSSNEVIGYFED